MTKKKPIKRSIWVARYRAGQDAQLFSAKPTLVKDWDGFRNWEGKFLKSACERDLRKLLGSLPRPWTCKEFEYVGQYKED